MKRPSDGVVLLGDLLDRHERGAGSTRRIVARPAVTFGSADERQRLYDILTAARDAGAVTIAFDRDAPHLIANVVLVDPDRLYVYLGRTPSALGTEAALTRLAAHAATTETGAALKQFIAERWASQKRALGLGTDQIDEAIALIRAADAAMTELPGAGIALRTRSSRLLGDSKALERALSKLVAFFKLTGRIPSDLGLKEAVRVLGLEKYPQPVLVAGPVEVDGAQIGSWAYAGLPPEGAATLTLADTVRSILTIENLESFNRHVRECRAPSDIVLYTGGFPGVATLAALRRLIALANVPAIWHWGDIDPGGVRIAAYLERSLSVPVHAHLMSIALADRHGHRASGQSGPVKIDPASSFAGLAAYLATPASRYLEQEVIDPTSVEALAS